MRLTPSACLLGLALILSRPAPAWLRVCSCDALQLRPACDTRPFTLAPGPTLRIEEPQPGARVTAGLALRVRLLAVAVPCVTLTLTTRANDRGTNGTLTAVVTTVTILAPRTALPPRQPYCLVAAAATAPTNALVAAAGATMAEGTGTTLVGGGEMLRHKPTAVDSQP